MNRKELQGKKITVMGLGLNGGGIETTRFLVANGAIVTVTDLRDETVLAPSLEKLQGLKFRAVLGKHEAADFSEADIVIKNPAVRPQNQYIAMAKRVETDLSLFFSLVNNPIIAVTGSKGKSTTASAIHYGLLGKFPTARIGGNITISPLSFLDELEPNQPVVMELSSFQLGDLVQTSSFLEKQALPGFPPFISIITSIFHDHQDYYKSMPAYIADKEAIFRYQLPNQHSLFLADDQYGPGFCAKSKAQVWQISAKPLPPKTCGAWLDTQPLSGQPGAFAIGWLRTEPNGQAIPVLADALQLAGKHHRVNLLIAATALHLAGIEPVEIRQRLSDFKGVEHRLETVGTWRGITFINDSAATIPEAALGAVTSLEAPIHLITGGTDKALEFSLYPQIRSKVASMSLLKGSASEAISGILQQNGQDFHGPFDSLAGCVDAVTKLAKPGEIVLLSPGCASFGMFLNEFDRGRQFKAIVQGLLQS